MENVYKILKIYVSQRIVGDFTDLNNIVYDIEESVYEKIRNHSVNIYLASVKNFRRRFGESSEE